jgi:hypothetical protein
MEAFRRRNRSQWRGPSSIAVVGILCLGLTTTALAQGGKPRITILATGRTIAGAQPKPGEPGYKAGSFSVEALMKAVPGLSDRIAEHSRRGRDPENVRRVLITAGGPHTESDHVASLIDSVWERQRRAPAQRCRAAVDTPSGRRPGCRRRHPHRTAPRAGSGSPL